MATSLLTMALALSGAIAFRLLPVSALPQVDFPTIQVTAGLPGASPETMASAVATPLERQFGHIAGITEMTSTSFLGSTLIVLQFDLSRDINGAARDVQAAINAARGNLPSNLPNNPMYRKVNPADAPILILSLTSDIVDKEHMYDVAATVLQQKISQTSGVGQVFVGGSSLPAVRVELNPTVVNKYGISLEQIRSVLAAANANRPKGELAGPGVATQIRTSDQLFKAREYMPLVVVHRKGAPVRVADLGEVRDSVEDLRNAGLANGKPAVLLVIFRQPGANVIATVDRVMALMPQLQASLPPTIRLDVMVDLTQTIRASIHDVELTLLAAVVLVALVVFLFLRSPRATFIPGVVVPLSLIGTFGVMYLLGYSVDNLSLMALTISTGFVVDDAIVVIENITRYLERGMNSFQAALLGSSQIGFTVVSMSSSLVAVFIPLLMMGGIVGRLFREFAVTLSVAIAISMVVSLTATPMMCAHLLKADREQKHGWLYHASGRVIDAVVRGYGAALRTVLRHPAITLAILLLTISVNVYLFVIVPKGFFPEQDTGRMMGLVQAEQDISFQAMHEKMIRFVHTVMADPAVQNVVAFTGGSGGVNTGRMFATLKDLSEREATVDQVIARIRQKSAGIPGASLYLQAIQDIRVGGRLTGAQFQFTLQSQDLDLLDEWAPRMLERMRKLPQLVDVNTDQQNKGLQVELEIDRDTASRLGLSAQDIDNALYDAFGQRQVSTMYTELNQYHVVMEVAPEYWRSPETLKSIYVGTSKGSTVPLAAFTRYAPSDAPLAVNHQGLFPAATISFNLPEGVALGDAVAAVEAAQNEMGMPVGIHGSFSGTAQAFEASLANEPVLIATALVAVYIVLGILYESYVHPVTILSTLPSAGVGALLALLLFHLELSVIALIGIILLIGIVKKNAILMIDFALEAERQEGKNSRDAIYEACLLRFRPITMTTMAAMLGALPLALGIGMGGELRRPLGLAIVGGLMVSQLLTLFTTPVVYLYLDSLRLWVSRLRSRLRLVAGASAVIALCMLFPSCAVGPKYKRPTVETPPAYKEQALPASDQWKVAEPRDEELRGNWWELFGDAQLNQLVAQVEVSNQNVKQAEAQFRQARTAVAGSRANYYPTISTLPAITVSKTSANLGARGFGGGRFDQYNLPFTATWEPDLWGRVRLAVQNAVAIAQASAADLENMRLSMQAELVADYFQLVGLDMEIALLMDTVAAYEQALKLTIDRYHSGVASKVDVSQAQTQLDSTRAQVTDLRLSRAQYEHAIAVLAGKPPSTFSLPAGRIGGLPPPIPAGVPSQLLERRPDIAASERLVAAANAQIGLAKTAFYPTLLLTATGGLQSGSISDWFSWPSRFWSVGPSLAQTLFDFGRRRAQVQLTEAAYDAAVASYRQTVLTAFQEVEDNLSALRLLAEEAAQQEAAVKASEASLRLELDRYKSGTVSYLDVITSQTIALTNQRTAVSILYRRMTAAVQLVRALGGSWNASTLPTPTQLRSAATPQKLP